MTIDDLTADTLEEIFHAALGKGDAKGVEAALTLMAIKDPHRAQRLLDGLREAVEVRQALDDGAEIEVRVGVKR
jgi:hypothetical protein